jgi:hypothetical protein
MSNTNPAPMSPTMPRRFPAVQLGGMLFTLVEPWRDRQVDYNRWYEGDHFYATVFGPGVLGGRRYVCTSSLKRLRQIGDGQIVPASGIGSYLALYWMTDTAAFNEWGSVNTLALHADNRIFTERDHIHTLMYDFISWRARDSFGVSPELALEHPFDFVVVEVATVGSSGSSDGDDGPWTTEEHASAAIAATGAELVLSFQPVPLLDNAPADVPRASGLSNSYLHLHFHNGGSPEGAIATLIDLWTPLEQSGAATLRFLSPFVPTIPGSDAYTGELW